jgi:hypothetical protein
MIQIKNGEKPIVESVYKRFSRTITPEQEDNIIAANSALSLYIESLEDRKKEIVKKFNQKIKDVKIIFYFLTQLAFKKEYESGSKVYISKNNETGKITYTDIETGEIVKIISAPTEGQKKLFETPDLTANPIYLFPGEDFTIETPGNFDYKAIKEKYINDQIKD